MQRSRAHVGAEVKGDSTRLPCSLPYLGARVEEADLWLAHIWVAKLVSEPWGPTYLPRPPSPSAGIAAAGC